MQRPNNLSLALGSLALGIAGVLEAALLYVELTSIGFPDGFRSALDRARETSYPIFIALAVFLTCYALYTSFSASRNPSPPHARRQFLVLASVAVLIHVACAAIDTYCAAVLPQAGVG